MCRDFPREVKRADHATSDALLTEAVKALEQSTMLIRLTHTNAETY